MSLWKSTDQANSAPKSDMGVHAKDKAYAQTAAYVTAVATLTQYSNVVLALASTANININDRVSSTNTAIQANLASGTIVTQIINSSAVAISNPYLGTTITTSANLTFQHNYITGYNVYNNVSPNAFQNGQTVGVFNVVNIPNVATFTANVGASGSAVLSNVFFSVYTTANFTQNSPQFTVTSNTGITPGLVVTANTPGIPANSVVTSVSGTTVNMTGTFTGTTVTGANTLFTQANVAVVYGNTTASLGANMQSSSNTVILASNVTGTTAAGILTVSAYNSGPPPQAYQNITSQASTWQVGGASFTGTYSVACNQITALGSAPAALAVGQIITSGSAGIPLNTTIAAVNSTVITMSAIATGAASGATVNSYYNVPIVYVEGTKLYLSNTSLAAAAGNTYTTTSLVGINPSMQVYTAATGSFTNAGLSVANVVGTNVVLTSAAAAANSNSAIVFSNIAIGTVASGNNIPTISSNTQVTNVTGTMASSGNVFTITAINSGPPPVVGQEITGSGVTNCFIVTACTSPVGSYVVSVGQTIGTPQVFTTVIPTVSYINTSAILLTSNTLGATTGNLVSISSYEKTAYARSLSAGWNLVKYGTGPVVATNTSVNAVVNSTTTTGYSNGETIVVSGGSANALYTITTNTQSGVAGANIASVAISYPGFGFTNTSTLTYTYQHQLHVNAVFIANASAVVTGYSNTDFFRITSAYNLANVTGYIAGSNLYVSATQTGTVSVGDVITATTTGITGTLTNGSAVAPVSTNVGITIGQIVTANVTGIPANTTVTSINATAIVMSAPYVGTTTSSGAAGYTFSIAANTQVLAQLTSNAASVGGTGVYALSTYQYVASNTTTYNNFAITGQIQIATANITTATGGSFTNTSTITMGSPGLFRSGFTNTNLTVVLYTAANVAGGTGTGITGQTASFAVASSGAPVNATLGGRSGRVMLENIVPISGKNENAADNTLFPNS